MTERDERDRELVARMQRGADGEAAAEFCRAHVGLVAGEARHWRSQRVPLEDRMAYGFAGLLKGARRFDLARTDNSVATYARFWVRAEVASAVTAGVGSRGAREAFFHMGRAAARLFKLGVADPTDEQLAAAIGKHCRPEHLAQARAGARGSESLEEMTEGVKPSRDLLRACEPSTEEVMAEADAADKRGGLARLALGRLLPRERKVIVMRFYQDATLAEVGDELGVCRERVRQIEQDALEKLRVALHWPLRDLEG